MKLATWNVNSLRIRLEHLGTWLTETRPDVVFLQETKVADDKFPADAIRAFGYPHLAWFGERTYNGVAVLSQHPLEDVRLGFPGDPPDASRRCLFAKIQGISCYGLYVPNGQKVGSDKFKGKLAWMDQFTQLLRAHHQPDEPLLVCGDFNVAPNDLDVWDPFEWEGQLLCHPEERRRLAAWKQWGLTDAFRHRNPFLQEFTWWDYRAMGFERNHGARIDQVLLSAPLVERLEDVAIDRFTRSWKQASDHCPVRVQLA